MDLNQFNEKFERLADNLDASLAKNSDREPIEEYDREFFNSKVYYEDAIIDARVIITQEKVLMDTGETLRDQWGPWILFRVKDIDAGDNDAKITIGSIIMAKWDKRQKVYKNYCTIEDPKKDDRGVDFVAKLMKVEKWELQREL